MKMPILALLRHAKSSWDDPAISDFDRPLNDRGKRAAPEIGRVMRDLKITPDIILCSPSTRTHQTLDLVLPHLKCSEPDVRYEKDLYHANAAALLDQVRRLDDKKRTALVVGHNPGLHALALTLAGEGATDDLTRLTSKFPTAALALLSFTAPRWQDVAPGKGWLEAFVMPEK